MIVWAGKGTLSLISVVAVILYYQLRCTRFVLHHVKKAPCIEMLTLEIPEFFGDWKANFAPEH